MIAAVDTEFRRQLDAGDLSGAGTWLVERCADDVLDLCTAMVRDRTLAEDLAQDAFGQAFRHLGSFRGDSSPRTWLMAIARNRCLDHLRRHNRVGWVVQSDPDAGDVSASDAPLPPQLLRTRQDVAQALAALDESQRALVVLRFRHGLGYDELGEVFGIKSGTARMRVSRALARMREALAGGGADLARDQAARAPVPTPGARRRKTSVAEPSKRMAAMPPASAPRPPAAAGMPSGPPPGSPPAPRRAMPASMSPMRAVPAGPVMGAGGPPGAPPADGFAEMLAVAVAPATPSFRSRLSQLLAAL